MFGAEIIQSGNDLTIIALGKMVKTAIEVAKILQDKKISCEIINARFLKPLDTETILKSINKTKNLITIEDGIITGGLASSVQALISNIPNIKAKYFAYPDEFIKHGTQEELEKIYHMDAESIANSWEQFVGATRKSHDKMM